ncbi:helix-turn-helix transcriptional regulator [Enterococcus dispar]|jgi:DNA-binding XRE family transcriptional regulator|uniref:helix-turn-helix transcriptional regulator n=1 Tax=Enterococcus dispar TaxID=44009 RepID=UPI00232DC961|nr:helix-turn-helix transcriptional regulator [Enterococcus dispar]WCG32622.1 helix-turn-helix transcriptional regulator [Enterococcus dispar]
MNKILGYRKMANVTQAKMAKELGISEPTYRNKEKGKTEFTRKEIEKFANLISGIDNTVTIEDIFFDVFPTKTDDKKEVV